MTKEEVTRIVNEKGKVGCTDIERYIDLPEDQIKTAKKTYAQVISFNDGERPLALCWLDKYDDLYFSEYTRVPRNIKDQVEEFLGKL